MSNISVMGEQSTTSEIALLAALNALPPTTTSFAIVKTSSSTFTTVPVATVTGALTYKGTWNASTNTPALASGVGVLNEYYVVSVAGTTTIDGISSWGVNDWLIFNGTIWQQIQQSSATNTWIPNGITTNTVGALSAGTNLGTLPVSVSTTLNQMLYSVQPPSASLTGGTVLEMGASPVITLAWTATKGTNSITAITVDGTPIVVTGNTQSGSQAASSVQDVTTVFSMSVTDGVTTPTASTTVSWQFRRFVGTSANTTLTESQIEALAFNALASSLSGVYAFTASATYKYFACPTTFAAPAATTGFKDSATLFAIGMAGAAEGYNLTDANGWNYTQVSVTNSTATPVTQNYRLYRSKNIINGSISITVS